MAKRADIICPACGSVMVPKRRESQGYVYSCPQCSCRKVRLGVVA